MDRGMYVSASGGLVSELRLDVVAHNLANVNTIGYKAQRLVTRQQDFQDTLAGTISPNGTPNGIRAKGNHDQTPGVVGVETKTDFSQGPLFQTGNTLDVSLTKPDEFFVVQTAQGETLTKAGNFRLDTNSKIVTQDGFTVQGEGGEITIPPGSSVQIASDGLVVSDKQAIGKLRVVKVNDLNLLKRADGTRFQPNGAQLQAVDKPDLVPGAVEQANVEVVNAMVDMINANKAFEAYSKTARTIDEMNERATRNARMTG
jgi:flagellar basal-body rod protein FlgF